MKVRPVAGADSAKGWLRPDCNITVLAVQTNRFDGSMYLLWSDLQSAVASFPAWEFEVVDGALSPYWQGKVDQSGFLELAPPQWLSDNFWERYHSDEPEAVRTFRKLRHKIEKNSGVKQ